MGAPFSPIALPGVCLVVLEAGAIIWFGGGFTPCTLEASRHHKGNDFCHWKTKTNQIIPKELAKLAALQKAFPLLTTSCILFSISRHRRFPRALIQVMWSLKPLCSGSHKAFSLPFSSGKYQGLSWTHGRPLHKGTHHWGVKHPKIQRCTLPPAPRAGRKAKAGEYHRHDELTSQNRGMPHILTRSPPWWWCRRLPCQWPRDIFSLLSLFQLMQQQAAIMASVAQGGYLNPMAAFAAAQMQQMAALNMNGLAAAPMTPTSGKGLGVGMEKTKGEKI